MSAPVPARSWHSSDDTTEHAAQHFLACPLPPTTTLPICTHYNYMSNYMYLLLVLPRRGLHLSFFLRAISASSTGTCPSVSNQQMDA